MPSGWTSDVYLKHEGSDDGYMLSWQYGPYLPGTNSFAATDEPAKEGSEEAECTFVNDETTKCYVYGGWWTSIATARKQASNAPVKQEEGELQLIGLGMRFGTSPALEDGEGNSNEEMWCRGTPLRVRIMEGKIQHLER